MRGWTWFAGAICLAVADLWIGCNVTSPAIAENIPRPISPMEMTIDSLGDDRFAFRDAALDLQHAGNLDGAIVPYAGLDYARLADWLTRLDDLDPRAEIAPTIAAYLFGFTQRPADAAPVIAYLAARGAARPVDDWRWLAHAVYLARYRMNDTKQAVALADKLAALSVPLPEWASDLRIQMRVDSGDRAGARHLLALIEDDPTASRQEQEWAGAYGQRIGGAMR